MEKNIDKLPEIHRQIASAVIISSDSKVLLGRKNPDDGGVYPDAWHIPGGGIEPDETLEDCMRREAAQEVVGIDLSDAEIAPYENIGHGETVKTIDGVRHWCKMDFCRFKVQMSETADELSQTLRPGDDLVELRWFDRDELADIKQIPGGREFFEEVGLV